MDKGTGKDGSIVRAPEMKQPVVDDLANVRTILKYSQSFQRLAISVLVAVAKIARLVLGHGHG
jgi:hypothetical protein